MSPRSIDKASGAGAAQAASASKKQDAPSKPCYARVGSGDPPNLSALTFVENMSGGDGGVDIYKDAQGKQWCVKAWTNQGHGINEIIGGELLSKMGVNTPNSYVYEDLPDDLKRGEMAHAGLFRVSEFIEGREPTVEEVREYSKDHFATIAFLSLWDTKPENLIVREEEGGRKEFYYIDTGSALLYRALGETKQENRHDSPWSAMQVTELSSLTTHGISEGSEQILDRPDQAVLDESIESIFKQGSELLAIADNLCVTLAYPQREKLMQMMTARLQHYHLLTQIRSDTLYPDAQRDALSGAFDACGILAWAPHGEDKKPHILIGKRAAGDEEGTWVILGGGADLGEDFATVAARETFEESGETIDISARDLREMPSHDLISLTDKGDYRRFRTYCAQTDYVDPNTIHDPDTIHDPEYSGYMWLSVDDLLAASKTGDGAFGDGECLHNPFLKALQQPQMRAWLEKLQAGEKVPNRCTQGIADRVLTPAAPADLPRRRYEFAGDFTKHALASRAVRADIRARKAKKETVPKDTTVPDIDVIGNNWAAKYKDEYPSPSFAMLNQLYPGKSFDEQLKSAIAKARGVEVSAVKAEDIKLVKEILTQEIQHKIQHKDARFAYHGTQSDIWLCDRVLSTIRHMLDETDVQTDVLRSLESVFRERPTAEALRAWLNSDSDANNYSSGYHGISCNPSIFGNLDNSSSCTLTYLLLGKSQTSPGDKVTNIVGMLFKQLGIQDDALLREIVNIYEQEFKDTNGALLQIMMNGDELFDNSVYLSKPGGEPVFQSDSDPSKDPKPSSVIDKISQGHAVAGIDAPNLLELRLHGNLPAANAQAKKGKNIQVVDHFNGEANLTNVDRRIQELLGPYLPDILRQLSVDAEVYDTSPTLQKTLRMVADVKSFERRGIPPIVKAYQANDLEQILHILSIDPTAVQADWQDVENLSTVLIQDTWIGALAEIEDGDTRKNLVDLLEPFLKQDDSERPIDHQLLKDAIKALATIEGSDARQAFIDKIAVLKDMISRNEYLQAIVLLSPTATDDANLGDVIKYCLSYLPFVDKIKGGDGNVVRLIGGLMSFKDAQERKAFIDNKITPIATRCLQQRDVFGDGFDQKQIDSYVTALIGSLSQAHERDQLADFFIKETKKLIYTLDVIQGYAIINDIDLRNRMTLALGGDYNFSDVFLLLNEEKYYSTFEQIVRYMLEFPEGISWDARLIKPWAHVFSTLNSANLIEKLKVVINNFSSRDRNGFLQKMGEKMSSGNPDFVNQFMRLVPENVEHNSAIGIVEALSQVPLAKRDQVVDYMCETHDIRDFNDISAGNIGRKMQDALKAVS